MDLVTRVANASWADRVSIRWFVRNDIELNVEVSRSGQQLKAYKALAFLGSCGLSEPMAKLFFEYIEVKTGMGVEILGHSKCSAYCQVHHVSRIGLLESNVPMSLGNALQLAQHGEVIRSD